MRGTLGFMWLVKGFGIHATRKNIYIYYDELMDNVSNTSYIMPDHDGWCQMMEHFHWKPWQYTAKEFADVLLTYL